MADRLLARNPVSDALFATEARRLAESCEEMAHRFLRGGRLLAFGNGASSTDAQHVSVEFVHPVIVGKRALPALDLSAAFEQWAPSIAKPDDMAMGFAPPRGDTAIDETLRGLRQRGVYTFALSGQDADFALEAPSDDTFISQELLEILYHTLWETVHVYFEHAEQGHDVGNAGFLYPFLGKEKQETGSVLDSVATSIVTKAADVNVLREQVALSQSDRIADAATAIADAVNRGGKLILLGNGGSATDANDLALDCVAPPAGYSTIPAISLSMEPANISAIANDIGADAIYVRQLIAQAAPHDIVVALSTSGGSSNIIAALGEARKRRMPTVAILGYDGGEVVRRGLADHAVVVTSDYIPRIQEVQASVYHVIRDMLEQMVNG